jgi:hypothetical protein
MLILETNKTRCLLAVLSDPSSRQLRVLSLLLKHGETMITNQTAVSLSNWHYLRSCNASCSSRSFLWEAKTRAQLMAFSNHPWRRSTGRKLLTNMDQKSSFQ